MHICVLPGNSLGLLPKQTSLSLKSLEMELDQPRRTIGGDKAEGMDTEPVHMPVRTRYAVSCHCPEQSVHGARLLAEEIPGGIVCGSRLRNLTVRAWLHGVDKVGELNGVLDEEDGNIISNNICRSRLAHCRVS
jgi:hypothetical protein